MTRALYFGCRGPNAPGHYLQEGQQTIYDTPPGLPWDLGLMDGGLLKNGEHPDIEDGRVWWTCGGAGRSADKLWYAFFWWDRSGDKRGASNSGFYVLGFGPTVLTPESAREGAVLAFQFACQSYPQVVARQHHKLALQGVPRNFCQEAIERMTWRLVHLAQRLERDDNPEVRKIASELSEIWNDRGPPVR